MASSQPLTKDKKGQQSTRALGKPGRDPVKPHYCDACFTGDYPISLPDQGDNSDRQLSLLTESR